MGVPSGCSETVAPSELRKSPRTLGSVALRVRLLRIAQASAELLAGIDADVVAILLQRNSARLRHQPAQPRARSAQQRRTERAVDDRRRDLDAGEAAPPARGCPTGPTNPCQASSLATTGRPVKARA